MAASDGRWAKSSRARDGHMLMPGTAARLLRAARSILRRHGYQGLSLAAVGQEAGEYSSLVGYYFGNKAGLIAAILDYNFTYLRAEMRAAVEGHPAGLERVLALAKIDESSSSDSRELRIFWELVPQMLHDDDLRERIVYQYCDARALEQEALVGVGNLTPVEAERLAVLARGVVDGVGLQGELDPEHVDHAGAFEVWREMLTLYLKSKV